MTRLRMGVDAASALAIVALAAAVVGCGGGSGSKPSGTGGAAGTGGNGPPGEIAHPCADAARVGGFELAVVPPAGTVPGYAQLIGTVQDRPNPTKVWQPITTDGNCRLMAGPTCSTSCTLPSICNGATCVPGPTTKTVGAITVTGLNAALSASPNSQMNYYAPVMGGFPPFAAGSELALTAAGGDYPGFSLRGKGFPLIETPSATLPFEMGKPFTVTWTAPPAPVATRMFLKVDIAFHGGVDAQIQCDVPDTGSVTVPASLVDALLAKGTAGFPSAFLTRRTIDSTEVSAGCIDFSVTSVFNGATGIQLSIPGVSSCNEDTDCPSGKTCGPDLKCK